MSLFLKSGSETPTPNSRRSNAASLSLPYPGVRRVHTTPARSFTVLILLAAVHPAVFSVNGSEVATLLGDDQFVPELAIDVVGAINEAVTADLDVEHLIRRNVRHTELRVVALVLAVHLRA